MTKKFRQPPKPVPKRKPEIKTVKRMVAVYRSIDIVNDEHGGVCLGGHFEYEDGTIQGIPQYRLDNKFLLRFLDVFGVEKLSQVNGKACWLSLVDGGSLGYQIVKLDPLIRGSAAPFDLPHWLQEKKDEKELIEMNMLEEQEEHDEPIEGEGDE